MASFDLITDLPSNQHHQDSTTSTSTSSSLSSIAPSSSSSFHQPIISPSPSSSSSLPPNPFDNDDIHNNHTITLGETTFQAGPTFSSSSSSTPSSTSTSGISLDNLNVPIYVCLLVAAFAACLISGLTFQWVIEKGLFRKKSFWDKTNHYNIIVAITALAALLQTLLCLINVQLVPTSSNPITNLVVTILILLNWTCMTHGSVMIVTRKLSLTYANAEQAWKKFLWSVNGIMLVLVTLPVWVVWMIGATYYFQNNKDNDNDDNMLYYYFEEIIQILEPLQCFLWGILECVLSGLFIIQMKKYFWQAVERKGLMTLGVVAICDVGLVCMNIFLFLYHDDHDDNDTMITTTTIVLTTGCVRGFVYALRIRLELEVLSSMVNYIQNKRNQVVYMARQHEQRTKRRKALMRKRRRVLKSNHSSHTGRVSSSGGVGSSSEFGLDSSDNNNNNTINNSNTDLELSNSGYLSNHSNVLRRSMKRTSINKLRFSTSRISRSSGDDTSGAYGLSLDESGDHANYNFDDDDNIDNDSVDSYQSVFDKVLRRRRGGKNKKKPKKKKKKKRRSDEVDDNEDDDDDDDDDDDSAASHMSVFQRLPHATDFSNIFQRNFMQDFATATQHSGNVFSSIGKKFTDFAKSATDISVASARNLGDSLGGSMRRTSTRQRSNRRRSSLLGSLRPRGGGGDGSKRRRGGGRERGKCVTSFSLRSSSCDDFPIQGMEINVNHDPEQQQQELPSPYVDYELDFPDDSCALQMEGDDDLEAAAGASTSDSDDHNHHRRQRVAVPRASIGYNNNNMEESDIIGRSCGSISSSDTYDVDKDDDDDDEAVVDEDGLAEEEHANIPKNLLKEQSQQSSVDEDDDSGDDVGPMMFGIARRPVRIDDHPTHFDLSSGEEKIPGPTTSPITSREQQHYDVPAATQLRRCASVNNQNLPPLQYKSDSARNLRESQIIAQMSYRDQLRRSSNGEASEDLLRALAELESMDCL